MDLRTSHTLGDPGGELEHLKIETRLTDESFECVMVYKVFNHEQQIKRELKGIHICGCRCNERLKAKTDGSTYLGYTGLLRKDESTVHRTR